MFKKKQQNMRDESMSKNIFSWQLFVYTRILFCFHGQNYLYYYYGWCFLF